MTATRVEVQEYDEEVMTYSLVRNWHAVAQELKEQVRQLQLDNVCLREKVAELEAEKEQLIYDAEGWKAVCEVNSNTLQEKVDTIEAYKARAIGVLRPIALAVLDSVPGGTE